MTLCRALALLLVASGAFGFAPTPDQCAVNVRYASPAHEQLLIQGQTYTLGVDVKSPAVGRFEVEAKNLLADDGLRPEVNNAPVEGPGRVNIYSFGTQMYEVHVRDLRVAGVEGDVELALYCYAKRVFANLNVTPRGDAQDLVLGWGGSLRHRVEAWETGSRTQLATPFRFDIPTRCAALGDPWGVTENNRTQVEQDDTTMWAHKESHHSADKVGVRSDTLLFFAGTNERDLTSLLEVEMFPGVLAFNVQGGTFDGYRPTKGFYQVTTTHAGPRGFEEAWINPNQRFEVSLTAAHHPVIDYPDSGGPWNVICNVRNTYGVLEGAVLTDEHGRPRPVQVQVCKNFGGEKEEGAEEGDTPYGEAYCPLEVKAGHPFKGRAYHLFGNWGTHPLKQISSIRFHHHYFHASLGPTETFCYAPFEFPRDDDRNYVLADVRGLTNDTWPGQPQHDHVSVVGALRYKSNGRWVNNELLDTRIYLTSPNMASFALDYLSEDGKIRTTLEIFELPQDDEARCFIKMELDVLKQVELDVPSAQNLRFLNAGAYIVGTRWPKLAYTNEVGRTAVADVPADDTWALEAMPLGPLPAFAAAYPHGNGNMCFFVRSFEGTLGGRPAANFGLSCFGGKNWTEMFLTAPEALKRLEQGDRLTAHLFVMPYGRTDSDHGPAEEQRSLYGDNLPRVAVWRGECLDNFPPHIKAGPEGVAEFTVTNGSNWLPLLVEGFGDGEIPMLWEKRGDWLFHDQQVLGNDWYQAYRAQDGSTGYVFVVRHRPGMEHHYLVTSVRNATAITQHNGFVTVAGGPLSFLSPVALDGLASESVDGTDLFLCSGTTNSTAAE